MFCILCKLSKIDFLLFLVNHPIMIHDFLYKMSDIQTDICRYNGRPTFALTVLWKVGIFLSDLFI